MGSAVLTEVAKAVRNWSMTEGRNFSAPPTDPIGQFGRLAFTDEVQRARLPKAAYKALRRTITHGAPLDASVADSVANALKDWAIEHGATHYTHWFQPLTGITAEKHDSFLSPSPDGRAVAVKILRPDIAALRERNAMSRQQKTETQQCRRHTQRN